MKLIEQRKLFFKEGNSDKVYEIDLCELSANEYIVNFRYGRRGGSLKEGTKTPSAVAREKADKIFSDLESEKRNKGYQTELETFIELPSLEALNPDSINGVILQRLQDAVEGKNTFKTEWKTSRVIWKAVQLGIQEAIPFIIKLATKGDEMQTYSALRTLLHLNAVQAEPVFTAIASQAKQKAYLRHIAYEGLLTVLDEEKAKEITGQIVEKLPVAIQNHIAVKDYDSLLSELTENSVQENVNYFSYLYLVCKTYSDLLPILNEILKTWKFRPPYFKYIRSIYKLAQIRKDYLTLATLTYRLEKEKAMFKRTYELDYEYKQYLNVIDKSVCVGKELRSKDSKLAFSTFTKTYFQKNSVTYLNETAKRAGAKEYLKLAVSTLLQYSESDYTPAAEKPLYDYGQYDYKKKLYYYRLINYPECSESLLLSTILFGNDTKLKLQPNLKYILGQRLVTSESYYYNPNKVTAVNSAESSSDSLNKEQQEQKSGNSVLGIFKSFFGGKKEETQQPQKNPADLTKDEKPVVQETENPRKELYPEYWDSVPEAYIQLLMQAKMDIIHRFAYSNLKAHPQYNEIVARLDGKALLQLVNSNFTVPSRFGFENIEKRSEEFSTQVEFVGKVLDSNNNEARIWAQNVVNANTDYFMQDTGFIILLIFNSKKENNQWLNELLQKTRFTEERQQAILGKVVSELLQLEDNEKNNKQAKDIISRTKVITSAQFDKVSWSIIEQLILSPLMSNILLASMMLTEKSKKVDATEIPVSVVELFLKNDIPEVRLNGIELLNNYPDNFLINNFDFVLNQADTAYQDVLDRVLAVFSNIVSTSSSLGERAAKHLVYTLIRKEKFEGAHSLIRNFLTDKLQPYWNSGLSPKDITKLIHAQYRQSQLIGYTILTQYDRSNDFSLGQIISFGNHEILAIRQWCWRYFKENVSRIRYEKGKALNLLDSKWDDTRAFAFQFFKTEFTQQDWDSDTLISIVDSIRSDVEAFGKELIAKHFNKDHAIEYLTKLSQHPSVNVQAFVTNYLNMYASGNIEIIKELDYYFRSVLTRVNKARVAKNRIFGFIKEEALKDEAIAAELVPVLDDVSAQSTVQDKSACIHILSQIKERYPHLDMHLMIKN